MRASIGRATGLSLAEIFTSLRFLGRVPAFLRRPFSDAEARAFVRERRSGRAAAFLDLVRRGVYERGDSPYRTLLREAGCELGDLTRLVHEEGIEGALRELLRRGVYLTVAEFKGGAPVRRGATTFTVDPAGFRNAAMRPQVMGRTSGSRGTRALVPMDLRTIRERAMYRYLALAAQGGVGWRHAFWMVPGSAPIVTMLQFAAGGMRVVRWFSQVDPASPSLPAAYRWSGRGLRVAAWLAAQRLPAPTHVAPDDALPIVRWIREVRQAGGVPHIRTFPSSAVRVCRAAAAAGLDIVGSRFTVLGEPLTPVRLDLIARAGAVACPSYSTVECGPIAGACRAPTAADDTHLYDDRHALVQPGTAADAGGLPSDSLLVTTVQPDAPLILLNVSLGDRAVLERRVCGCPLEGLGWTTHLHTIRSFEKLTAAGMTVLDADVIHALDELLPTRFGGGPTSYQLVEITSAGPPSLELLVHPALGRLDEVAIRDAFLDSIAGLSSTGRVTALRWRAEGLPRIERRPPLATATGKILHVHQRGLAGLQ
ncbi:MAG TPA: hypothetical protein VHO73_08450 [Methylomirabilota bacterium]|jgi:hypothetical protein|nr:hypothetical protein [Methylomirabilota bacterium]